MREKKYDRVALTEIVENVGLPVFRIDQKTSEGWSAERKKSVRKVTKSLLREGYEKDVIFRFLTEHYKIKKATILAYIGSIKKIKEEIDLEEDE